MSKALHPLRERSGAPVEIRIVTMTGFHKNGSFEPFLWNCAGIAAGRNRRAVSSAVIIIGHFPEGCKGNPASAIIRGLPPIFPAAFPFLPLIRKPDQTLSKLSPARRASGFLRRRGVPAARRQRAERMGSERASFKIRISPSPVGRWRRCLPRRAAPCWAGRRRSSGSREWRLRRAPVPWTCRSPGRR